MNVEKLSMTGIKKSSVSVIIMLSLLIGIAFGSFVSYRLFDYKMKEAVKLERMLFNGNVYNVQMNIERR